MPRLLDLCCGIGGAAMGYSLAGYDVTGVDDQHQPDYPFRFVHGDAIEYVRAHGHEYDLIRASWPCQASCTLTTGTGGGNSRHPQLIPAGRDAMRATGRPWLIENVPGAPIRHDLMLCGEMFGLSVIRHRYFELSAGLHVPQPVHLKHRGPVTSYRHGKYYTGPYVRVHGHSERGSRLADVQQAMDIRWTNDRSRIVQAIPAAYTRYIGEQLLTHHKGVTP